MPVNYKANALYKILAEIQAEIGNECNVRCSIDKHFLTLQAVFPENILTYHKFTPEMITQTKYDLVATFIEDSKQTFEKFKAEESRHRVEELLKE